MSSQPKQAQLTLCHLEPGDKVGIIAPSAAGKSENLPLILTYVKSLDLVPIIRDDIYNINPEQPFYSNTDQYRATDLIEALLDPEVKAIWCIRGGQGAIRLIPFLEAALPPHNPPPSSQNFPKLLIGFSDITVLHLYFQAKYANWPTLIHGPMLESIVDGFYPPESESILALKTLMFNLSPIICLPLMTRLDRRETQTFPITGKVAGGNLTLTETSVGTKWQVDTEREGNRILFLEDRGEQAYSIERSFDHMKQVGIFQSPVAIVFGDFMEVDDETLVDFVLQRFANDEEEITCPVFRVKGIGHGQTNFPLPVNSHVEIREEDEGQRKYRICYPTSVSS